MILFIYTNNNICYPSTIDNKNKIFDKDISIISYREFNNLVYKKFNDLTVKKDEFETNNDFKKKIESKLQNNVDNIFIKLNGNEVDFKYNADKEQFEYDGILYFNQKVVNINKKDIKFLELILDTINENTDNDFRHRYYRVNESKVRYGILIPYSSLNTKFFSGTYTYNLHFSFKCKRENAKETKSYLKKIILEITPIFYNENDSATYTHYYNYYKGDYARKKELTEYNLLFCYLKNIYVIKSDNNEILGKIDVSKPINNIKKNKKVK